MRKEKKEEEALLVVGSDVAAVKSKVPARLLQLHLLVAMSKLLAVAADVPVCCVRCCSSYCLNEMKKMMMMVKMMMIMTKRAMMRAINLWKIELRPLLLLLQTKVRGAAVRACS